MIIITSGDLKGRKIQAPDKDITRPTLSKVRMSVFNTLFSMFEGNFEGKSFLDMYAGSGIMGFEALSRRFGEVVAIEKNKKVYSVLQNNLKSLNIKEGYQSINGDSLKSVLKFDKTFDVVYIDPPYFSGIYEKSLSVLKRGGIVVLEHVSNVDFGDFEIVKQKKYGDKFLTFCTY